MTHLPQTIQNLAQIGVNLEISANANYLPKSLEDIVRIVVGRNCHITIHAGNHLPQTLEQLAHIGGKNLTIKI